MEPRVHRPLAIDSLASQQVNKPCDLLVIGIAADKPLSKLARQVDQDQGGWIDRAVSAGVIKAKRGEMSLIPGFKPDGPAAIMTIGLGDPDLLDRGNVFELGGAILRRAADTPRTHLVVALADRWPTALREALVAGLVSGCEGQSLYRAEATFHVPDRLSLVGVDASSIHRGEVIGLSLNLTRRLVNQPPNVIYPATFAEAATEMAAEAELEIEVWDEQRLAEQRCRAILAVGGASSHRPRLVILRYHGGAIDEPPLAVVGKGITFDSGGLSLKPSDGMFDMKCDMAGAATVLGVLRAAALLKLPVNLVGVCGLAENMISGNAYRLGDVIETRSGRTIEIHNTDAEGRVVLADALDVAVEQQPVAIIDLATLTGACMVALGRDVAGLMANDSALCDQIASAAEAEGEWVWQLPMFPFFDEQVKSKVADLKNVGDGRWGGAITAAKFLEPFVKQTPWVHIDIAGPAFADSAKPCRDAGATGVMVRTLIRWLSGGEQA